MKERDAWQNLIWFEGRTLWACLALDTRSPENAPRMFTRSEDDGWIEVGPNTPILVGAGQSARQAFDNRTPYTGDEDPSDHWNAISWAMTRASGTAEEVQRVEPPSWPGEG